VKYFSFSLNSIVNLSLKRCQRVNKPKYSVAWDICTINCDITSFRFGSYMVLISQCRVVWLFKLPSIFSQKKKSYQVSTRVCCFIGIKQSNKMNKFF